MRTPLRPVALAVLAACLAAPHPAAAGERVEQLVARVLDAYGGRAALERARIVRQEGTVTSLMHPGAGHLVRLLQRPASLRVEIAYPGAPVEVRVVHGGHGDRGGVEVTGTPAHAAMVLQAARLALPLALAEPGARVADRGELERDDRRVRALALALPGGLEVVAEIDPASGRILRSTGAVPVPGAGGRIEFATVYSEWKRVGGVLFAFHEENWARGRHTGDTSLQKVELLREPPPGAFDEGL
ncbi:hypothetical protein [Anaeromyxobacter diazotrophicus]|uniref:Uncharacterized protein n=1 Tax=Anaeromyxobacter diazotrophicus TaxID=2590199 RepID=A0A7I9VRV8_9BACT|nr:hypothetical protein [Anaeromyxobacter diazotrophicus]GEJ58998.1 hypothetical protein AMYX_37390 [Anaeromyxobacter diazotrophicus]